MIKIYISKKLYYDYTHIHISMTSYKKISTQNDTTLFQLQSAKKCKINDVSASGRKDVWDEYRYTQTDVDRMNDLIQRYEKTDHHGNKRKLEHNAHPQSTTSISQSIRRMMTRSMTRKIQKEQYDNTVNINFSDENHVSVEPVNMDNMVDKMLGWVSATRTKYYLLHDQAIDWLNMYFDTIGIGPELPTPVEAEANKKLLKDASHIDVLFEGGNVFEKKIFDELKDIFDEDFVLVFDENDMKTYREQKSIDGLIREKNQYVKSLMNQGVPIIAQAPLINDRNKTFGVADILIRTDYLKILFKNFTPDSEIDVQAPYLTMKNKGDCKETYHYRVIDCKWTTMVLCVDGLTIRNEGLFPAYKGQLAVYTAALESLQGYVPNCAYIMSKAWRIDKANIPEDQKHLYKGFSAFDRPGVINYGNRDRDYLIRTKEAVQWMQRVMTEGRDWRYELTKLSKPELYPNMNKSYNPVYDKVKDTLAKRYGDPTMVWYVGTGHRENAHAKGIYDITDPRCTLEVLGIDSTKGRGKIIKQIIDINRNNQTEDLVRPKKIHENLYGWRTNNTLDYFVDFETINYNLFTNPYDMDIDNSYFDSDVTFMIGFGFNHDSNVDSASLIESLNIDRTKCDYFIHIDVKKGWEFVCLHLVNFKLQNELELFRLFYQFIILRQEIFTIMYDPENEGNTVLESRMFHWTQAETRFMRRAVTRIRSGEYTQYHMENRGLDFTDDNGTQISVPTVQKELNRLMDNFESSVKWIDMCDVFEKIPIVIKGSFRFKLKHIGNAFCKNGLIDTRWDDGRMSDGFRAMLEAIKLYRSNKPMTRDDEMYREIIDYNEIDCRVVWEIVHYLRANH